MTDHSPVDSLDEGIRSVVDAYGIDTAINIEASKHTRLSPEIITFLKDHGEVSGVTSVKPGNQL